MHALPLWLLVLIFIGAGAVVWVAGIQLSKTTGVLDSRLHIGSALGGLIVLAVATNLPELAITVTAAASGSVDVAVGNILGGIALQTVVLVVLDLFGKRAKGAKPLTHRAASLTPVIEALVVLAVLTVVIAGTQLPASLDLARFTPEGVLILVVWVAGLLLVKRAGKHLPWQQRTDTSSADTPPAKRRSGGSGGSSTMSTRRAALVFAAAAIATLVAGFVLEQSGDAASSQVGLSGILFGATVLALATSLPEISTGLQSIRQGDDDLAIGDIFGGNAFLPVLFLLAALISGKAVLPHAQSADIYLTAVAMLLTAVYAFGLLFRPTRRVLGMGVDSLAVLALYIVGIGGLVAVAS